MNQFTEEKLLTERSGGNASLHIICVIFGIEKLQIGCRFQLLFS